MYKINIDLSTNDINDIYNSDIEFFIDMPKNINILEKCNSEKYLFLFESELIRPDNWKKENHKYFKKLFTWNDNWVDEKKYIKYYWPNKIPEIINFNENKKKLCCMIAGCKFSKRT